MSPETPLSPKTSSVAQEAGLAGKTDFSPRDAVKKVGKGKTLSQPLTPQEADLAFTALLSGRFTEAQAGAFLQALRIQELSQHELDALIEVFHRGMVAPQVEARLHLNLASDTARKGGILSLIAAAWLGQDGLPLVYSYSEPVLTQHRDGLMLSQNLASDLGGLSGFSLTQAVRGLASLSRLRGELGFRSCLHTAEKLVHPFSKMPVILGISHKHYAERMCISMKNLGRHGFIVLGNHGTCDLVLHKETVIFSVSSAGIREIQFSPRDWGLQPAPEIYTLGNMAAWPAWLKTGSHAGFNDALRYQAAFLHMASGASDNLAVALEKLPPLPHLRVA